MTIDTHRLSMDEFLDESWHESPPNNWSRIRLGFLLNEVQNTVPAEDVEQLTPSVVHGVVPQNELENKPQQALREGYELLPAQPGDFVVSMSSHSYGIEYCDIHGGVSPDYTLLRPTIDERQVRFLKHLFKSQPFIELISLLSSGIRHGKRIYWSDLQNVEVCLPDPNSAEQIADNLDEVVERIDKLVNMNQSVTSLLDTKRQTTISEIVTKGTNPTAEMQSLETELFGEVPKHWNVVRLKFLINKIEQGWSPQCRGRPAKPDEWGVLKAGAAKNGVFYQDENKALPDSENPRKEYEIKSGDLLMNRASGSPDLLGSVALVSETRNKLLLCDKIMRLDVRDEVVMSEFLSIALQSHPLRNQIRRSISGAEGLANNIPQADVKELVLPVPPLDEQKDIIEEINTKSRLLRTAYERTQELTENLQEKRESVVTHGVVGKPI